MSAISRELQESMGDVGKAFSKIFEGIPTVEQELKEKQEAADARAKAILAHVRELGDDY